MEINEAVAKGIEKLAELNLEGRFPGYMHDGIYRKPNFYPQLCHVCGEGLMKGDLVRKEQSGATRSGFSRYIYAHLDCFLAMLFHTIIKIDGDK